VQALPDPETTVQSTWVWKGTKS